MTKSNTVTNRKFQAAIRITFHPNIHPGDAEKAFLAWMLRTAKSRKKPTPEAILEDAFLSSLANNPPSRWNDDDRQTIFERLQNKDFCERLARAMSEGRAPMFDPVAVFILRNWRVMRLAELAKLPGLSDWSPKAAAALIGIMGLPTGDEGWYSKRRARLGLSGRRTYRVKDCLQLPDRRIQIDID
jgi:hypothetical protein